ncbi:MAG: hypothetical protein PF503_16035 [Desulfobacula sp.]|nr:hypothetical protein [Desulfobacula sp.]
MFQIKITDQWHCTFPQGHVGLLLIGNVDNSIHTTTLDQKKKEVESNLREKFAGFSRQDLVALEVLKAYRNYYKKFKKTYHVQLQLESIRNNIVLFAPEAEVEMIEIFSAKE